MTEIDDPLSKRRAAAAQLLEEDPLLAATTARFKESNNEAKRDPKRETWESLVEIAKSGPTDEFKRSKSRVRRAVVSLT